MVRPDGGSIINIQWQYWLCFREFYEAIDYGRINSHSSAGGNRRCVVREPACGTRRRFW